MTHCPGKTVDDTRNCPKISSRFRLQISSFLSEQGRGRFQRDLWHVFLLLLLVWACLCVGGHFTKQQWHSPKEPFNAKLYGTVTSQHGFQVKTWFGWKGRERRLQWREAFYLSLFHLLECIFSWHLHAFSKEPQKKKIHGVKNLKKGFRNLPARAVCLPFMCFGIDQSPLFKSDPSGKNRNSTTKRPGKTGLCGSTKDSGMCEAAGCPPSNTPLWTLLLYVLLVSSAFLLF